MHQDDGGGWERCQMPSRGAESACSRLDRFQFWCSVRALHRTQTPTADTGLGRYRVFETAPYPRGPRPPPSRMGGPWLQPWGTRIRMESASRPIGSRRARGSGRPVRTCPFVWMTRSPEHAHGSRAAAHRQCHPANARVRPGRTNPRPAFEWCVKGRSLRTTNSGFEVLAKRNGPMCDEGP